MHNTRESSFVEVSLLYNKEKQSIGANQSNKANSMILVFQQSARLFCLCIMLEKQVVIEIDSSIYDKENSP